MPPLFPVVVMEKKDHTQQLTKIDNFFVTTFSITSSKNGMKIGHFESIPNRKASI